MHLHCGKKRQASQAHSFIHPPKNLLVRYRTNRLLCKLLEVVFENVQLQYQLDSVYVVVLSIQGSEKIVDYFYLQRRSTIEENCCCSRCDEV